MTVGLFFFALFLFYLPALASGECPAWAMSQYLPPCPGTDTRKLPETYPALAYVISDAVAGNPHKSETLRDSYSARVAFEILTANVQEKPQVIVQTTGENFSRILELIRTKLSKSHTPEDIQKILSRVKRADVPQIKITVDWSSGKKAFVADKEVWQQDYFSSLIDVKTGAISIHPIDPNREKHLDSIMKSLEGCPIYSKGESLISKEDLSGFVPGSRDSGGNIQALPGGLCVHGDNQSPQVSKRYCGSPNDEVILDTSWLNVGHVDEIVNVVKAPHNGAPCNFAVNIASPRKALELMNLPENQQKPFFDFQGSDASFADAVYDVSGAGNLLQLCQAFTAQKEKLIAACQERPDSFAGIDQDLLLNLTRKINALDSIRPMKSGDYDLLARNCDVNLVERLSNKAVAFLFTHDPHLSAVNDLIQAKMDKNREILNVRLKERFPSCEIDIIEVPNLFSGAPVVAKDGRPTFAKAFQAATPSGPNIAIPHEQSKSLVPNPTNGIVVGNTYIAPHPRNEAFYSYLQSEWKKRGVDSRFVDTFRELHFGGGQLHCATNSLRVCRPSKQ